MAERLRDPSAGVDGPLHPRDLDAWRTDVANRGLIRRLRGLRARLARTDRPGPSLWLGLGGPEPDIAFGLTRAGGASRPALVAPLERLPHERVAIVATFRPSSEFSWCVDERRLDDPTALGALVPAVRVAASAGHYRVAGGLLAELMRIRAGRTVVVQHGLLTPDTPPLAPDATLLAWTSADAAYWSAGRGDVESAVVGSQLLADAADAPVAADGEVTGRPVFLGQLHASEFGRPEALAAALAFCRAASAAYRPHPSEVDAASRLAHRYLRLRGVELERSGRPLATLGSPVVATFSTGVLEAAARGLPAWVSHPSPPPWLTAFWERYGMAVWGANEPTPAPVRPVADPAGRVAELLVGFAEGSAPATSAST